MRNGYLIDGNFLGENRKMQKCKLTEKNLLTISAYTC